MSRKAPSRREFLTLPLALILAPLIGGRPAGAAPDARKAKYGADISILYGVLTYRLEGTVTETVDRGAGQYEVAIVGEGDGIANRVESRGTLWQGRWAPLQTRSFFSVKGRESRSDITYDYARRSVAYHFKGETFFLRKLRVADDVVPIPEGMYIDDTLSATLNYTDQLWVPQADGTYLTRIVRRKKPENEGADDVQQHYKAELVPFTLKVVPDASTGKTTAHIDLTRFSSWAKQDQPGKITFDTTRRLENMSLPMMLGTSVQVRIATG